MNRRRVKNSVRRLLLNTETGDTPPIDVYSIAASLGVEVVEKSDLTVNGSEASGLLLRTDGRTICVINQDHHPNRKRFSLAHELGHYVLHPFEEAYVDRSFYARSELTAQGTDALEIEANAFAAELLMPETVIKQEIDGPLNVIEDEAEVRRLARLLRVSQQAMTHRLTNLRLLGES